MDREILVQNIKELCKAKDIFPTVACRESGVGNSFINDLERGKTPSVAKVQQLAHFLGVSTSELLGEMLLEESRPVFSSQKDNISPYEWQLLQAYRKADKDRREIVQAALRPFGLCHAEETAM